LIVTTRSNTPKFQVLEIVIFGDYGKVVVSGLHAMERVVQRPTTLEQPGFATMNSLRVFKPEPEARPARKPDPKEVPAIWSPIVTGDANERSRRAAKAINSRWSGKASEARRPGSPPRGGGHPSTSDPDYPQHRVRFFMAVEEWKRRTGRRFPTLNEIINIAEASGWTYSEASEGGIQPVRLAS
jgi:hypothetical protein